MSIFMNTVPKLFYTPDELKDSYEVIYLHFCNSSIKDLEVMYNDGEAELSSMTITRVLYRKVYYRNAKYPYVYVMDSAMAQFMEIYK